MSTDPANAATPGHTHRAKRKWLVPATWIGGAAAAAILSLGVTGTLSSWTAAILNNNTNSAATANAVVLQEQTNTAGSLGAVNADCQSSNGGFSNTSTCSEINKYGGTATPLTPGSSQATTVTFTNIGSGAASKLVLTPGSCAQTPAAGTGSPVNPANLCASAATDLNLNVKCADGSSVPGATGNYTDLAYNGALGAFTAAKTHTATIAHNATLSCTFTVSLSASASPLDGGITVSQPLTWELDA